MSTKAVSEVRKEVDLHLRPLRRRGDEAALAVARHYYLLACDLIEKRQAASNDQNGDPTGSR